MSETKDAAKSRLSKEERSFGKEMQRLRKERGMSQSDMAEVLKLAGIEPMNQVIVSRIENGLRPVTMREAQFISAYFKRSTWSMMVPEGVNILTTKAHTRRSMNEAARLSLQNRVSEFLIAKNETAHLIKRIREVDWDGEHPDAQLEAEGALRQLEAFVEVDVRAVVEAGIAAVYGKHPTAP